MLSWEWIPVDGDYDRVRAAELETRASQPSLSVATAQRPCPRPSRCAGVARAESAEAKQSYHNRSCNSTRAQAEDHLHTLRESFFTSQPPPRGTEYIARYSSHLSEYRDLHSESPGHEPLSRYRQSLARLPQPTIRPTDHGRSSQQHHQKGPTLRRVEGEYGTAVLSCTHHTTPPSFLSFFLLQSQTLRPSPDTCNVCPLQQPARPPPRQ